jgi:predicted aspartyl protease
VSARVRELAMGGVVVARAQPMAVGDLPTLAALDPPIAGLLGADVLAKFEVEFDPRAARMALYSPSACAAWLPWPGATPVPFSRADSGLVYIDAAVDGGRLHALLDTGARTSMVTQQAARTLGVTDAMLAGDEERTGGGVGRASVSMRRHRFATLSLPGVVDRDVALNVADVALPGAEMLLGADFLGRRQVWISYATGRLFLR